MRWSVLAISPPGLSEDGSDAGEFAIAWHVEADTALSALEEAARQGREQSVTHRSPEQRLVAAARRVVGESTGNVSVNIHELCDALADYDHRRLEGQRSADQRQREQPADGGGDPPRSRA